MPDVKLFIAGRRINGFSDFSDARATHIELVIALTHPEVLLVMPDDDPLPMTFDEACLWCDENRLSRVRHDLERAAVKRGHTILIVVGDETRIRVVDPDIDRHLADLPRSHVALGLLGSAAGGQR
jgi:hypothetical protein